MKIKIPFQVGHLKRIEYVNERGREIPQLHTIFRTLFLLLRTLSLEIVCRRPVGLPQQAQVVGAVIHLCTHAHSG
jgi:hypothetical protein